MIEQAILNRVLKRYNKALKYSTIDPEVSLSEARKTAEAILKLLYTQQKELDPNNQLFNKPVEKKMLSDLASIMEKIKRYPLIVSTAVRTIQAFGNIGAHDQGAEADYVDQDSILSCTTALKTLMKWFWQDVEQDMTKLSSSTPSESQNPHADATTVHSMTMTNSANEIQQGLTNILQTVNAATSTLPTITKALSTPETTPRTTQVEATSPASVSSTSVSSTDDTETRTPATPPSSKGSPLIFAGIGVVVLLIGGWFATRSNTSSTTETTGSQSLKATATVEQPTLTERISSVYNNANIPLPPTECQQETEQVLTVLKTTPVDKIKASTVKDNIASSVLLRALLIKNWHSNFGKNDANKPTQESTDHNTEIKNHLQSVVTDCSSWSFPHAMLGNYWYAQQDYAAAQAEYAVAISNESHNPEVLFNSTIAYLKTKEFDKALKQINLLEQNHPNHDNLHLVKTQVLIANSKFTEAEESGVKAYNDPNSNAKAALLLWQVYSKMEQPEMANEYACSALKLGMEQAKAICKESK